MKSLARANLLILLPVVLLSAIGIAGLVAYRHSITHEAIQSAQNWASTGRLEDTLGHLKAAALTTSEVVLYKELPGGESESHPDSERLTAATAENDTEGLLELTKSDATTTTGIPVAVLAAWRLAQQTGERSDALLAADFAINQHPSAISLPILRSLQEQHPDQASWLSDWANSENERAVLRSDPDADGIVASANGPVFVTGKHVLMGNEFRSALSQHHSALTELPDWMAVDFVARDQSMLTPVSTPLASVGSELKIAVGIGDRKALFASYRRVVVWFAAVIACAIGTALFGIWTVQRTLKKERRISELKSQFVASVSHELRTPVASMRLMADALDAGKVKGAAAKNFHRLMSQEGARLSSLIENVLDFARIEEGRKDYSFATADLPALITDTIHLMQPVAEERDVHIKNDLAKVPEIEIDSGAIEQALINLIANAIKFAPKGSTVQINLTAAGEAWQLSVADNGPGIPRRDRQRVFDRFTRLGNELRRETQGTGIGLSIVKHIVEAHGATITIEDNHPTGTKFIIRSKSAGERGSKPVQTSNTPSLAPEPCDS